MHIRNRKKDGLTPILLLYNNEVDTASCVSYPEKFVICLFICALCDSNTCPLELLRSR